MNSEFDNKELNDLDPSNLVFPFHVRLYIEKVWLGDGVAIKYAIKNGWRILLTKNFEDHTVKDFISGKNWYYSDYDYTEQKYKMLKEMWGIENINRSSLDTSHFAFVEAIQMGYDLLPYVLFDLKKQRNWFALLLSQRIIKHCQWSKDVQGNFDKMTDYLLTYAENVSKLI